MYTYANHNKIMDAIRVKINVTIPNALCDELGSTISVTTNANINSNIDGSDELII
jgi:hypothetical protein